MCLGSLRVGFQRSEMTSAPAPSNRGSLWRIHLLPCPFATFELRLRFRLRLSAPGEVKSQSHRALCRHAFPDAAPRCGCLPHGRFGTPQLWLTRWGRDVTPRRVFLDANRRIATYLMYCLVDLQRLTCSATVALTGRYCTVGCRVSTPN